MPKIQLIKYVMSTNVADLTIQTVKCIEVVEGSFDGPFGGYFFLYFVHEGDESVCYVL